MLRISSFLARTAALALVPLLLAGSIVPAGAAPGAMSVQQDVTRALARPQDFLDVMSMLEASRFPVEQAVTAVVSLEEAPSILSKWSADPAAYTKIMIQME